jgi:hypothetical protein
MTAEGGAVMAERPLQAAGFWPRRTVQVATRVLPGSTRDRYRQEFLAELHGLSRTRQLRHAAGVLSRSWALRAAISTPPEATTADMDIVYPRLRRPKRYSLVRTADGYEIRDAESVGAKVFFSASHRAARNMLHALNRRSRPGANNHWTGGYAGGGQDGGGHG